MRTRCSVWLIAVLVLSAVPAAAGTKHIITVDGRTGSLTRSPQFEAGVVRPGDRIVVYIEPANLIEYLYEIKIAGADGRVRELKFDAETGKGIERDQ